MIRWVISPVYGTGDVGDEYHAAVSSVAGVNSASLIPTFSSGPSIGQPKFRYALSLVAAANMITVSTVPATYVFPDYPLDGRMDGMEADARLGLSQSPHAYDFDGNGMHLDTSHSDSDSYRDVINKIGRQIDPAFDSSHVGVPEVAG